MDAYLDAPEGRRRLICTEAGNALGLAAASVEKDFWVCWTLRELFGLPSWGEQLWFKGGTSLSKGWKLIDRFSEDLDVVIGREFLGYGGETLSRNRQKKLVKECSTRIHGELMPALRERIAARLPKGDKWALRAAPKDMDPDEQTLLFEYPPAFGGKADYIEPWVRIEMGSRSAIEPAETPTLQPYICDALPDAISNASFAIRTVVPRRTFWDKAMLLHEETYRPADKAERKPRMSRHYYDVWAMIRKGVAEQAVADQDLFERVAAHRVAFFGYSWMDYSTLRRGALRLLPLSAQAPAWKTDYDAMRREMFFGDPPSFDEILKVVGEFEQRFNRSGAAT